MIFPEKSDKWNKLINTELSNDVIYDINNKVGFRGKCIKYLKKYKNSWAIRWYRKIYNLQLNDCEFNIFHEKRNIYAKGAKGGFLMLQDYQDIKKYVKM